MINKIQNKSVHLYFEKYFFHIKTPSFLQSYYNALCKRIQEILGVLIMSLKDRKNQHLKPSLYLGFPYF